MDLERRCGVCGSWRWCGRSCGMANGVTITVANTPAPMANTQPDMANVTDDVPGVGPASTYRYRDTEERRTYMRDYMRRRRARKDG